MSFMVFQSVKFHMQSTAIWQGQTSQSFSGVGNVLMKHHPNIGDSPTDMAEGDVKQITKNRDIYQPLSLKHFRKIKHGEKY